MNLRQFVVSRAHLTFAEVADSVKTYQELIKVETVSHIFKNVSFEGVGCSLCHKPHKSLECPSLRSIIEMEVSSFITPTDLSSSSSGTRSRIPTCGYGSCRPCYFDRSRSSSRSPNRFDQGNSYRYDNYDDRNSNYRPMSNDRYYQGRNDRPRYDNRYGRSKIYSPQHDDRHYNNYDNNPAPR